MFGGDPQLLQDVISAHIIDGRPLQEAEDGRRLVGIVGRELDVEDELVLARGGGHGEDPLQRVLGLHAEPVAVVEQRELVVEIHGLRLVQADRVAARHVLGDIHQGGDLAGEGPAARQGAGLGEGGGGHHYKLVIFQLYIVMIDSLK